MNQIKQKISNSKKGEKNPNSTKVKCKNIKTNKEYHFNSQVEMQNFFNETNHQFISRRCNHQIQCLYKNQWLIAYENQDYIINYNLKGETPKKGIEVQILNLKTNELRTFKSIRQAAEKMPICSRQMMINILKGVRPQIKGYKISYLK